VGAFSLNVTVAPAAPLTYRTLWPYNGRLLPAPTPVSTLNSLDGRVVANAALVGSPGQYSSFVTGYATGNTRLVLDVNGYFMLGGVIGAPALHLK